jgi:hypothetical protein
MSHKTKIPSRSSDLESLCANRGLSQSNIAVAYAVAILNQKQFPVDWKRVNAAIEKRWSLRGLERVKEMAWSYFEDDKKWDELRGNQ